MKNLHNYKDNLNQDKIVIQIPFKTRHRVKCKFLIFPKI